MRINNNIMAFNANRNLGSSNMRLGKSLEKLSSGYRISFSKLLPSRMLLEPRFRLALNAIMLLLIRIVSRGSFLREMFLTRSFDHPCLGATDHCR